MAELGRIDGIPTEVPASGSDPHPA